MTKDTLFKIAFVAVTTGAFMLYLSSIPFFTDYSNVLEIAGTIPFYSGLTTILGLFLTKIK